MGTFIKYWYFRYRVFDWFLSYSEYMDGRLHPDGFHETVLFRVYWELVFDGHCLVALLRKSSDSKRVNKVQERIDRLNRAAAKFN